MTGPPIINKYQLLAHHTNIQTTMLPKDVMASRSSREVSRGISETSPRLVLLVALTKARAYATAIALGTQIERSYHLQLMFPMSVLESNPLMFPMSIEKSKPEKKTCSLSRGKDFRIVLNDIAKFRLRQFQGSTLHGDFEIPMMFPATDPQGLFTQKLFNSNADDFGILTGLEKKHKKMQAKKCVIHQLSHLAFLKLRCRDPLLRYPRFCNFHIIIVSYIFMTFEEYESSGLYRADFPTARQHPRVATLLNQQFKHHQKVSRTATASSRNPENPRFFRQLVNCQISITGCHHGWVQPRHKVIQKNPLRNTGNIKAPRTKWMSDSRIPTSKKTHQRIRSEIFQTQIRS